MPRGRPIKCPYCRSTNTVAKGHRKTATLGLRSLRKCKTCGRRFTQKKPVEKAQPSIEPQA